MVRPAVGRAVRPGQVPAHAPDESVPVDELVQVTRTLVRFLATAG